MKKTLMVVLCSAAILASGCATSRSGGAVWEYKSATVYPNDVGAEVTRLGQEGWKLVSMSAVSRASDSIEVVLLLKRQNAARAGEPRSFATETEITYDQKAGHYLVVAKVSELITEKGEPVERLVAAPRMTVVAGKPAAITDTAADGTSVRAEVSWPVADSDHAASLLVTLKSGGKVLARSKVKLDLRKT